jgi:nitrate reductase gamma subunit
MTPFIDHLVFGIYPYIALVVFLGGSLIRYDREQYTWKSDSSQMLRSGQLRLGSNLFHVGVLFLFFGHLIGLLMPHALYAPIMTPGFKQLMAMVTGGVAGALALIGLTILLHRRLFDPRIRATSRTSDIVIAMLLWVQLVLGMATIPLSGQHLDGTMMMAFAEWAQRIVTFRGGAADVLVDAPWVFRAHIVLGLTMFVVFPFTRLVHIWSGFGTLAYLGRAYQLVRSR